MKRVFVGLSGGVDSAVSAALLKEQGCDVVGAFIKIWQPEFLECTWREDRLDAMRVASALGIPFREIDLSEEYKREVVDTMLADYARGITPNPDVLCNVSIKFGHFAEWAAENGADFVATGHYARVVERAGKHLLLRGADKNKDQSYFLYRLGQKGLARALFPIGALKKSEVRGLAERYKLPNAGKPDSQGLCFVGDIAMDEFLGRFFDLVPGSVVDMEGTVIGEHKGAALYTTGQRHGFTTDTNVPHYVVSVDTERNTVRVSPRRSDAESRGVGFTMHWIHSPVAGEAEAQTRYRESPVGVRLQGEGNDLRAEFGTPHIASLGQSLVLYRGEECLGGGILKKVF